MKKIFALLNILIALSASAQKHPQPYNVFKGDTINRTDAKGLKQGAWKKFYSNDTLFSTGQYKDAKPYGTFITYYKSGKLEAVLVYRNGTNIADAIIYHENG